jgi:hypothetical protein
MRTHGWASLAAALLASVAGCFYVEPINERPGAGIDWIDPEQPMRGEQVSVQPNIYDPDGDDTVPSWSVYACAGDGCDTTPFDTANTYRFDFTTPFETGGGQPTTRVVVELEVFDEWGAAAVPIQGLDIIVGNASPVLEPVQRSGRFFRGSYPVGTPVRLTAFADDDDDGVEGLSYDDAILFPPTGATLEDATFVRIDPIAIPDDGEAIWELVADVPGLWEVSITVHDFADSDSERVAVPVAADHPPCIGASDPGFPPEGARIVVDELRRFSVLAIDDDLDLYPAPSPNDDILGAASFRWFLASPASGGALQPIAVDGNGVDIDPAAWTPGDQLELRVEAVDQLDRPLCDAAMATCELVTDCFQRQTWSLEVR